MIQKKFYLHIIIRVVLIIGLSILLAINLFQYEKLFTVIACGIGLVLLGYDLIRFTNKFNREVLTFFEALKYEEHSFGLKKINVPGFQKLSEYMNELNEQLSAIRIDNEVQALYLKSIVEHIQVGLLAVHKDGKVEFFNSAAQKILDIHNIGHIDAIMEKYPEFGTILKNLKPGRQKLVKLYTKNGIRQLSLKSSSFHSQKKALNLYSFQNIESEIEETEIETWQKLIRVLTHEINNSITPIHSLSGTLKQNIKEKNDHPEEVDEKTIEGLDIIKNRSIGLLDFVEKFRSLTPTGKLQKEKFPVEELLYRIKLLMQEFYMDNKPITLKTETIPAALELRADQKYVEQVLINLVKNAIEAIDETSEGNITLTAFKENNNTILQVKDNGPGIEAEETDRIFIPFYTTKKQGSGIGLSLSRQIMLMHGGNIVVSSAPGKTVFTLRFKE